MPSRPSAAHGAAAGRAPVRVFNALARAAVRCGWRPKPFAESEHALLEEARRATGHDDFGDDFFRDGR